MNAWAKRGLQTAFFTGGMLVLGAGIASANECCPDRPTPPLAASVSIPVHICDNVIGAPGGPYTTPCVSETLSTDDLLATGSSLGADQLLAGPADLPLRSDAIGQVDQLVRGNHGHVNLMVPVDISGNALAAAGSATTQSTSQYAYHRPDAVTTDGSAGALAGNVVAADWVAPIAITGNAGSVLGSATADSTTSTEASSGGEVVTDGSNGPLAGNVVAPAFATPVQFSGNALAAPGSSARTSGRHSMDAMAGGAQHTTGSGSAGSGNVGAAPLALPVQFNDNGVAWVGRAESGSSADAAATAGGVTTTDGAAGQVAGNVVSPAVAGPVAVSGDAVSWIGYARTEGGSQDTTATAGGDVATSGKHSLLSGNTADAAAATPVQVLGSGVSWIGAADASYDDTTESTAGGEHNTFGGGGFGSGNVASMPLAGPVQAAGVAAAWIAAATADSSTDTTTTADAGNSTSGDNSVASGTIADTPVAMPVQIFGVGGTWIGDADARHDNAVDSTAGGHSYTRGDNSLASGTMASTPVAGPADVFGVGGAWIGHGSGEATSDSASTAGGFHGSSGNDALLSGNNGQIPVALPGQVFGVGGTWIGSGTGSASNIKESTAGGPVNTDDDHGTLSANAAMLPVSGPVEVFGVGGSWIGNGRGTADSETTATSGGDLRADGTAGTGSGNVGLFPAALPVQVFGDGVTWIGYGDGAAEGVTTSTAGGDVVTDGTDGAVTGNVVTTPFGGTGQLFGVAASWIGWGDGAATNETAADAGGSVETSGANGPLAGNVVQGSGAPVAQLFGLGGSFIGDADGAAGSTSAANAGGPVTTSGVDAPLAGNVAQVPALATGSLFGDAAAVTASADGIADGQTASTSGGPVTTDGTGGTVSGNIGSVPVGLIPEAFGDAIGAVAGSAFGAGSNDTTGAAGGSNTTAGTGFLNGVNAQLPLGTVVQPYDIPIELLGDALADGFNTTALSLGTAGPQVNTQLTGESFPAALGGDTARSHAAPAALPLIDDTALPVAGLPMPAVAGGDVTGLDALDGFGLPSVGSLPTMPAMPGLDALPTVDGLSLPGLDGGLPGLDGVSLPGLDGGLPTVDALPALGSGLPGLDGMGLPGLDGGLPGLDALPGLDGGLPTAGALPTMDALPAVGSGLPGLDGVSLPGLDGSLPSVDGMGVDGGLPGVDALPGLDGGLPAVDALPSFGSGLPGVDSLSTMGGLPGVSTMPGMEAVPGLNGEVPGLDAVPGFNGGLPGVDGLPGLQGCMDFVSELTGGRLPSAPGVPVAAGPDSLPGLPELALPTLPTALPTLPAALPGLPTAPAALPTVPAGVPGMPSGSVLPVAPMPMPLDVPLPTDGDQPALGSISGFDLLRGSGR